MTSADPQMESELEPQSGPGMETGTILFRGILGFGKIATGAAFSSWALTVDGFFQLYGDFRRCTGWSSKAGELPTGEKKNLSPREKTTRMFRVVLKSGTDILFLTIAVWLFFTISGIFIVVLRGGGLPVPAWQSVVMAFLAVIISEGFYQKTGELSFRLDAGISLAVVTGLGASVILRGWWAAADPVMGVLFSLLLLYKSARNSYRFLLSAYEKRLGT